MAQTVKIAVNSIKGDDNIGGHTGKSRKFWVYTVTEKKIIDKNLLTLTPDQTIHNLLHGQGNTDHPILEMDGIVCAGIGAGAIRKLGNLGIEVFLTPETSVTKAMDMLIDGTLTIITPEGGHGCNCGGHDHDYEHHH